MKKIPVLILIMFLLCGCSSKAPAPPQPVQSTVSSAPPTSAATAAVPEPTAPALTLLETAPFLDSAQNLQEIPLPGFSGVADSWYLFGDHILAASFPDGYRSELDLEPFSYQLSLLSLATGEVESKQIFSFQEPPYVQICRDSIALTDWSTGIVRILDENLQLKTQRQFTTGDDWNLLYLDYQGENVYTFSSENDLERISLATGQKTVLLSQALNITVTSSRTDGLCISYLDREDMCYRNLFLDYRTGTLLSLPFPGSYPYADCVNGLWLVNKNQLEECSHLLGNGRIPLTWTDCESSYTLIEGPAPMYSLVYREDDTLQLNLYRQNGDLAYQLTTAYSMGYLDAPMWHPASGGYFLTARQEDGNSRLLYWKPTPSSGQSLPAVPLSRPSLPRDEFPPELYDRADALSEQYGLQILLGSQCGTEYPHFTLSPALDTWAVSSALDALEEALASYPEGFTQQLLYGAYEKTEIHLVDSITATNVPEDANGFTEFAAFVYNSEYVHSMILDVHTYNLTQTIYHEFSHIIDDKLDFHSRFTDRLYAEWTWSSLNPPEFSYADSIYSFPDSYYDDGMDAYFIDTYARTHATEDRARILEYAMSGNTWYFAQYAPLQKKLAYYSACIRDAFHTEGWPEVTVWEQPLNGFHYVADAA